MSAARGARPLKEAFFVQVMSADDTLLFFDETANLGRKMPYTRPEATCAMRATGDAVLFSMKKLTVKSRQQAVEQRLELPRGPLDRTERRTPAVTADLRADQVLVELDDEIVTLNAHRDESGILTLETPGDGDDTVFDLPRGPLRLTLYLRSPRGSKTIAASFHGHIGKPESKETVVRAAAIALNLLSGLPVFRLVSGIETVVVPASPARFVAARPKLRDADRIKVDVPVRLWTDEAVPTQIDQAIVEIELDLETASPVNGRLLFHLSVPAEHEETFKAYRAMILEAAAGVVGKFLSPDEIIDLVYSISLGELSAGDLGRLRDAVATITGLDVNPRQWATYEPVA